MCFLCGEVVTERLGGCRRARTLELRHTILEHCDSRLNACATDRWALDIQGRMQSCCDLIAEEALYHVNCYHRFTGEKHLQREYDNTGRPENSSMLSAFNRACDWSESCSEGINRISLYHIIQQIHAE